MLNDYTAYSKKYYINNKDWEPYRNSDYRGTAKKSLEDENSQQIIDTEMF